jgi:hypothetical protein
MVDMIVVFYLQDLDEMKRKASFYAWMFFVIGCGSLLAMSMQQVREAPGLLHKPLTNALCFLAFTALRYQASVLKPLLQSIWKS